MSRRPSAIFLINLLQDLNILRPLIIMARRDFEFEPLLLIPPTFERRDQFGIWRAEVSKVCQEADAQQLLFQSDLEVTQILADKSGLIFAASESTLSAHVTTHSIFRFAPPSLLRVTLQHGFECPGFRHSADHVAAYGQTAAFGADIVCSWYGPEGLTAMTPSQRTKLHVTGPTMVLQQPTGPRPPHERQGLVCENLHSVRLNIAGDFKTQFVDAFAAFCDLLAKEQQSVILRPHPGGQYVLKNQIELPPNAVMNNAPMYRLDLRRFAYGISAPSSVLIDMLLAEIPTAVWRDGDGRMDADNYAGLAEISTPSDWLEFSKAAISDPAPFLDRQSAFLARQGMMLDPAEVFARFADLFEAARRMKAAGQRLDRTPDRVLFVANANIPTLQLSFTKPLMPIIERRELAVDYLFEEDMKKIAQQAKSRDELPRWVDDRLDDFAPTLIVMCRYSGVHHDRILRWAKDRSVPLIYHIDDDLLDVPDEIGDVKAAFHNSPRRIQAVRDALAQANLVYCSTPKLKLKLLEYFPALAAEHGPIYCSAAVLKPAVMTPVTTVGYMGFGHGADLAEVVPAIVRYLREFSDTRFELFGTIPKPEALEEFGERVTMVPPVRDYAHFLQAFSERNWQIGICPLAQFGFNMVKANTKWVEYSATGVAVIASLGTVYDECCSDECGILAETEDEWYEALVHLTRSPGDRFAMVERAQRKLEAEFSIERLRSQVLEMFSRAKRNVVHKAQSAKTEVIAA
jgi:hypothetical protein